MYQHNESPYIGKNISDLNSSDVYHIMQNIIKNIEKVVAGKTREITLAVAVALTQGHLLIEDIPGVGKTTLAKALARSIDCTIRRVQFTPDLMPGDLLGVTVYQPENHQFEFRPGPIFANIVLGDEINRASPKTQSALLECMEEQQVTVDGTTYELHSPFIVIATQNPIDMAGTYPLPEAQRDRFAACIALGYPDHASELAMIDSHETHSAVDITDSLSPVCTAHQVEQLTGLIADIYVSDAIKDYVVTLTSATRNRNDLRLGASPRATLQLIRTARAIAVINQRNYVIPEDIHDIFIHVLAHRIIPNHEMGQGTQNITTVLEQILSQTPIPHHGFSYR